MSELSDRQIEKYRSKSYCCPFCESPNVSGGSVQVDDGGAHQSMGCSDCDEEWTDLYELVGIGTGHSETYQEYYFRDMEDEDDNV